MRARRRSPLIVDTARLAWLALAAVLSTWLLLFLLRLTIAALGGN